VQPPASLKALGDPIYEAFYGLTEQPFAITTDPRFFYLSAAHQRAFSELLNGLKRRESLLLLTGETGSGKTTLCRAVLEALGDRTFSAIVLNPYMTGAEVLRIVLRDFGFVSPEDLRRGALAAADVPQLLDALEGFLRSLLPLAGHAVIVIDEAQSLAPAVLDQIRMLTNLEHDGHKLLQVVLCGQPSLAGTVKGEALQALNERITRRIELVPLAADDVTGYIQHRMGVAGAGDAVRFDAPAMAAIADLSRGLPRRVNVLCDRALQEGRIEGASLITIDLVKRSARALAGIHDPIPAVAASPPPIVAPAPVAAAAAATVARAEPEPDRTPVAEFEAEDVNPFADLPGLSFGQANVEDEPRRRSKVFVLAAAGLVAVSLAGYFIWATAAGAGAGAAGVVPPTPTNRILNLGAPAQPIPVPGPEEFDALFAAPLLRPRPAAPPETPDAAVTPPSAENPDNSN
jgi:general secretion pathway protein A